VRFEGDRDARGGRFAIAASRFHRVIVDRLVDAARDCLERHGVDADDVDVAWVPGAFELPLVARRLASAGDYEAVICVGAVIRGETPHFDYVAAEAARGIADVARDLGVPVAFGVITAETLDQARDRAGGAHGNKGWDAALAAIEMASLLERLPKREG
jgi:6,7-dimethyl-8-ribityllumazine synthase